MCKDALHPFLERLPKVEHHLHIEGTLEPELLFQLASQNNVKLPTDTEPAFASIAALQERFKAFSGLDDFLHYYYIGMSTLIAAKDFEALATAYFHKAHSQGVRHAEVFFDPQAHTSRGVKYGTVVEGLQAARKTALRELGLSSVLIPCFLRHLPAKDAGEVYQQHIAADLRSGAVGGIGLDSSEKGYPPELFTEVFGLAREQGYRRTAHAGEEAGPENVSSALEKLGVMRIDHGRTIPDDKALLERIAKQKTLVTLCPLSNVCLRGVKKVDELPIRTFIDAGVRFSINSDDPAFFGGYILDNYCAVQEAFKLSKDEWLTIAKNAVEGSWCEEARKIALRGMVVQAGMQE